MSRDCRMIVGGATRRGPPRARGCGCGRSSDGRGEGVSTTRAAGSGSLLSRVCLQGSNAGTLSAWRVVLLVLCLPSALHWPPYLEEAEQRAEEHRPLWTPRLSQSCCLLPVLWHGSLRSRCQFGCSLCPGISRSDAPARGIALFFFLEVEMEATFVCFSASGPNPKDLIALFCVWLCWGLVTRVSGTCSGDSSHSPSRGCPARAC